jgi:hypothetical protein
MWNVYTKGYASRGATTFCPVLNIVQYVYKWYTPNTGVCLGLSADDTFIYATDQKEGCVLRKVQWGLSAIETWCELWNIKVNEDSGHLLFS